MGKCYWWRMTVLGLVLALALAGPAAAAEEKSFINGIDANFPPFGFVDKTGKPAGFDVEIVNWIAGEMKFKVKHQPMDWDGIIPSLNAKKIDFIASGMSATEERAKVVNFTIPYWFQNQIVTVKKESSLTVDQALKGSKKVGVQKGTVTAKWFEEMKGKDGFNYTIVYYDSTPLSVEDLLTGRIDAVASDNPPIFDAIKKGKPVKILGEYGQKGKSYAYAVRKSDTDLLNTLNEGLKKAMAAPVWKEMIKKYDLDPPVQK